MVVDALDLCYTKSHVDTFVIISGDSDFSPLVSKLRENNKTVIGVGVKKSTSDLFISNCDEFIYYDDLVRVETARKERRTKAAPAAPNGATPEKEKAPRKQQPQPLHRRSARSARENPRRLARGAGRRLSDPRLAHEAGDEAAEPGFNERAHGFRPSTISCSRPRSAACSSWSATSRPGATPSTPSNSRTQHWGAPLCRREFKHVMTEHRAPRYSLGKNIHRSNAHRHSRKRRE